MLLVVLQQGSSNRGSPPVQNRSRSVQQAIFDRYTIHISLLLEIKSASTVVVDRQGEHQKIWVENLSKWVWADHLSKFFVCLEP